MKLRHVLALSSVLFLGGCQSSCLRNDGPITKVPIPSAPIGDSANRINEHSAVIGAATGSIGQSVTDAKNEVNIIRTDPNVTPTIDAAAQNIDTSLDSIENQKDIIDGANIGTQTETKAILTSNESVKKLEDEVARLKSAEEKEKAARTKTLYQILSGIFAIGILITIAGGLATFLLPSKKTGLGILGIGILVTAIASALTFYLQWVAIIGAILLSISFLTGIGFATFEIRKWMKKSQVLEKATKENVELIQSIKSELPEDVKKDYFGDPNNPTLAPYAHSFQSETTIEVVDKVLEEIKAEKTAKHLT